MFWDGLGPGVRSVACFLCSAQGALGSEIGLHSRAAGLAVTSLKYLLREKNHRRRDGEMDEGGVQGLI